MTEKSSTDLTEEYKASIRENLSRIFETVKGKNVTVAAATKTVSPEAINFAIHACGLACMGENRVQELLEKYDKVDHSTADLHFIGRLQCNKVRYIADKVSLIHSLDSLKLAGEIGKRCGAIGRTMPVLCEVNIGNEEAKGGIPKEETADFIRAVSHIDHISVQGIMVIGPHREAPDDYRPMFEQTADLFRTLKLQGLIPENGFLSMGMSDNYALAVEYGANIIRPGTAIFGKRDYPTQ